MDETANLSLPYIMPQQALKHVTHNEALRDLDALVQLSVLDRDLAAPPDSPAEGDRYLVATGPSGAWDGHAGAIAAYQDGGWQFHAPRVGWRLWIADEGQLVAWTGSAWVATGTPNPAPMIGVVATADTTNRLAVKSDAALFANDDVTPGSGDMRVKISKSAAGNTASLVFQDAFSGRAEFGLAGDDDFHVKVSADGSSWSEAIHVAGSTGAVGIGTAAPGVRLTVSENAAALPAPTAGTMLHVASADGTTSRISVDVFGDNNVSPNMTFRHARGTAASPSAIQAGDQILNVAAFGYGTTGYSATTRSGFTAMAGENWTDTAQGSYFAINTTGNGSTASSERLRIDTDGSILVGSGSKTVLTQDGILHLQSFAKAALPSASPAGQLIYVSNGTSNKRLAVSDGSSWRFPDGAVVS